jgi:hypothetical protein
MKEERLIKILKAFSQIKPDDGFIERSQVLILSASRRTTKRVGLQFGPVLAFVSLVLLLIFGGLSYLNAPKTSLTSLDADNLLNEAANLDISIHFKEAKYFDESVKEVAAILERVSKEMKEKKNLEDLKINKQINNEIDKIIL